MQTNPAVEQSKKTLNGLRIRGISPVGEVWRKGFAEEPSLNFRMKD